MKSILRRPRFGSPDEVEESEGPSIESLTNSMRAEGKFSVALNPPSRSDRDFSDRLWQFIRKGHSAKDMYDAMQLVLDRIEMNVDQIDHIGQKQRRTSILGFGGPQAIQNPVQPLLPILRSDSSTKLSEFIRLVSRQYVHKEEVLNLSIWSYAVNGLTEC